MPVPGSHVVRQRRGVLERRAELLREWSNCVRRRRAAVPRGSEAVSVGSGGVSAACGLWDRLRSTISGLRGVRAVPNAAKRAKSAVALAARQAGGQQAGELVLAGARSPVPATGTRVVAARSVGPGRGCLLTVGGPEPADSVLNTEAWQGGCCPLPNPGLSRCVRRAAVAGSNGR